MLKYLLRSAAGTLGGARGSASADGLVRDVKFYRAGRKTFPSHTCGRRQGHWPSPGIQRVRAVCDNAEAV